MLNNYRPWGQVDWLLEHSHIESFSFIGCLATEPRCVEAVSILEKKFGNSADYHFAIINDPIHQNQELTAKKISLSRNAIEDDLSVNVKYEEFELLGPPLDVSDYIEEIAENAESIVLDISCMPKRFFFTAVKSILESNVKNFLVVYTKPSQYCTSGVLSGDPETLEALPFFNGSQSTDEVTDLLLGIGHSELGLVGALERRAPKLNLHVLFPFPPGPPSIEKNWRFMHAIQELDFANKSIDPIRVSASSVSDAFDHMMNFTNDGEKPSLIAPYGPKPMSLAMCLFAIFSDSEVVYTQPQSYNPNYSDGVLKTDGGKSSSYAYWIAIDGKNLFF